LADFHGPNKCSAHLLFVTEATIFGDLPHLIFRFLEAARRRVDTNRFDGFRWRAAALLRVDAGEVPRAHVYPLGEDFDPEVLFQMLGDPALKLAKCFGFRFGLCGEQRTVLRLTARTLQIYDKDPRNVHGSLSGHSIEKTPVSSWPTP
jgi:hypothetical protein